MTTWPAASDRLELSDAEWRRRLTPEQYDVLRGKGTEAPFCGGYAAIERNGPGVYHCAGCDNPLFASTTMFTSGTGWPSFFQALPGRVEEHEDASWGMVRTEITCARCGGHLGHVFDDGPAPTGKRYCINAVALRFVAKEVAPTASAAAIPGTARATFAAGCFWGVEDLFRSLPGVIDARCGYEGGHAPDPTYAEVCDGTTGHAEAVEIDYDPARISYQRLLEVFWTNHDPTTRNRQGPDVGSQYRSVVFYHTPEQKAQAEAMKRSLDASGRFRRPLVTEIVPAQPFYRAEEYHQRYFEKHGGGSCHRPS